LSRVVVSLKDVAALLRRINPDIVHVHFIDYPLLYWFLLRPFFKYKLVVSGHGSEVSALHYADQKNLPARLLLFLARKSDRRTGTAREIAARLEAACDADVVTVPNGVDTDYWGARCESRRGGHHLVSVGRLSKEKGYDVLLRSIRLLAEEHMRVSVSIIGEGPERVYLSSLIAELGLEEVVTLTGMLNSESIRKHFGTASIFVLPSRSEGMPLALLEAMAAGLAIISTNVGGIPNVVFHKRNGLLVEPDDPKALASAISCLLESPEYRTEMAASAKQTVKSFSLYSTIEKYLEVYSEVLGRRLQL
jgi:glycosyltransferase involved in cell wall biosynthesis